MNVLMKMSGDLKKWAAESQALIDKAVVGSLYDATYALYQAARQGLYSGNLGLPERQAYRNPKQARKEIKGRATEGAKIRSGKASTIPLKGLSPGVLYKVYKSEKRAEVGFVGIESGAKRIAEWAEEMAGKHAPGYTILYDKELRDKLHGMGIHLKKTTTQSRVGSRNIIDIAKAKHAGMALEKLVDSFERKMAGERT